MSDLFKSGFRLGDCSVDPKLGQIERPDGTAHVAPTAMEVLLRLVNEPGKLVERDVLVRAGWGDDGGDHEDALTRCIAELRQALGDHYDQPEYIQTVPRRGYRLVAPVVVGSVPEPQSPHEGDAPPGDFWEELKRRDVVRTSIAYAALAWLAIEVLAVLSDIFPIPVWIVRTLVVLAVIGFPITVALSWAVQRTPGGFAIDMPVAEGAPGPSRISARKVDMLIIGALLLAIAFLLVRDPLISEAPASSIAVLPFDNLSGEPDVENICDGIVEELLNELTRVSEMRVVGRKASFYYRDRSEDWDTIADSLGANFIVEGSVRKHQGRMRVAAQLIDRSGYHVWSDTFDAPVGVALDILAIQRSIARQVANAMPLVLSGESQATLESTVTDNEWAYVLYMQGRSYLRDAEDLASLRNAEKLFQDALDADATFTNALSGLCETRTRVYRLTLSTQDFAKAASTCTRLVGRDELSAEGFVALGMLNRLNGDFEEARGMFEKALEIAPTYETALYGMARAVEGLGDYDEAEQYYLQSLEFERGYWQVHDDYGRYLERGGRYDEAEEQYQTAIRLAPDSLTAYTNLGALYFDTDRWEEAVAAWTQALDIGADPITHMNVGTAQYYMGELDAAEASFDAGLALWADFYPLWGKLGAVRKRKGDADDARAAFENAAEYSRAVIAINEQDARAMYYLASYLAHLGEFEEAREWSARATELEPRNPAAHYFAAIVNSLSGDDDAAIDSLVTALQLGYSVRVVRADTYFTAYLKSARLAEWMQGDV